MKTVARFYTAEEAYMFRAFLDSKEIESWVLDEFFSQNAWHLLAATKGLRLSVDDKDYDEALEIYLRYEASLKEVPDMTTPVRAWPLVLAASLVAGLPIFFFGRRSKKDS